MRRCCHVLAALLLLALVAPARAASEPVAYALIVSSNTSVDPTQPPLRYADDDGARYHELLAPRVREAVLLGVLDEETRALHPGLAERTRPPTRAALREALGHLEARMAEDRARGASPVLYLVFAGHGRRGPAGEGTFSLLDGMLTRTELFEQVLAPSRAVWIHLFVDTCDSYYLVNARGRPPVGPSQAQAVQGYLAARELARYPHVGAVLSTSREQESHEWSTLRSGLFSHLVRSGLTGAADANGDGRVEYAELRSFITSATEEGVGRAGRLEVSIQPPALEGSAPLVDLREPAPVGHLLLPRELMGRWWVEDERGLRVAELPGQRERALRLALQPGRRYLLRSAEREASFAVPRPGVVVDAGLLGFGSSATAGRGGQVRPASPWPRVLLAAAGVALAAGVGLGLAARHNEQLLSQGAGGCTGEGEAFRACFASRLEEGRQQAQAANVLLGAGAVAGAGGALLLVWELP